MGYVWLLTIGAAVFIGLALLGVGRALWSFVVAALMLGAAGYAWQGRPAQGGTPVRALAQAGALEPELVLLRERLFGRVATDEAYLAVADAATRAGDRRAAVRAVLAGVGKHPGSAALWTRLGETLAEHDQAVSPPALFAFRQAARLAPRHPGPPFFQGLAHVRVGEFDQARDAWRRALALTAPQADYRPVIIGYMELMDAMLAQQQPR